MSFSSNEKSYGGYSSFSPIRHAERNGDKKERNENIPKYVHDKVEEIMEKQKEKDEGKAWAVAWSIYCRYKKPGSPHCKKETGDYFPSRKASDQKEIARVTQKIGKALNKNTTTEREKQLTYYMWTHGKFPSFLVRKGGEARILGRIANEIHYEKKPLDITSQEERVAYKALAKIIKFCHVEWGSKVWSNVYFLSGDVLMASIRIAIIRAPNIEHGAEYSSLIRLLFS
jgi:hypothetical protein